MIDKSSLIPSGDVYSYIWRLNIWGRHPYQAQAPAPCPPYRRLAGNGSAPTNTSSHHIALQPPANIIHQEHSRLTRRPPDPADIYFRMRLVSHRLPLDRRIQICISTRGRTVRACSMGRWVGRWVRDGGISL